MALFRLTDDNFEVFTVQTNPFRSFASGTGDHNMTGSVPVYPRASRIEKNYKVDTIEDPYGPYVENNNELSQSAQTVEGHIQEAGRLARENIIGGYAPGDAGYQDVHLSIQRYLSGTRSNPGINNLLDTDKRYIFEYVNRIFPTNEITSNHGRDQPAAFWARGQFTGSSNVKKFIKDAVFPKYRVLYPDMQFNYTNYHCLNFFTASSVPSDTVLLYPDKDESRILRLGDSSHPAGSGDVYDGNFSFSEAMTFDFYINPKYTTDGLKEDESHFHAGTLFHLSSSYALSLVTGSGIDANGYPDRYRLLLQLSHSADTTPSEVDLSLANNARSYPEDLIFLSDDNMLKRNHWHHIAVRWGTNKVNQGSGSFYIDGSEAGTFMIPSASVGLGEFKSVRNGSPCVLCVGNYYQGDNYDPTGAANSNKMNEFFNTTARDQDGLYRFVSTTGASPKGDFNFNHPLNAEVHDLKLFKEYRSDAQVITSSQQAPEVSELYPSGSLTFYVPPFFVKESPLRQYHRDSLCSTSTKRSEDPTNVDLSFRVGGREINLENFGRNFAVEGRSSYPRLYNLTSSVMSMGDRRITSTNNTLRTANDLLFMTGTHVKKCLTILPCDNGLFMPNVAFLMSGSPVVGNIKGSSPVSKFVSDLGALDLSKITLNTSMSLRHVFFGADTGSPVFSAYGSLPASPFLNRGGEVFSGSYPLSIGAGNSIVGGLLGPVEGTDLGQSTNGEQWAYGVTPKTPIGAPNTDWAQTGLWSVLQETGDTVSNEVSIFSITNLFYGDRILPKSFVIYDSAITGSDGKISVYLRDNGYGGLYRADALTPHAKNNSVGNIVYTEGIVLVKSPHLILYGKDGFATEMKGERNIHVLKISTIAHSNMVNSSSNPGYKFISASLDANDSDQQFVYITGINYHDENLNVVMKTKLAQPVLKRSGEKLLFRTKMDF